MLLLQLLFLMACFVLMGEPLRAVFSRWSRLLQGLDILQILVLDTYFGGFVLYAIAIFPFSLISKTSVLMLTLIFGAFSLCLNWEKFLAVKKSVDRRALQNICAYLQVHKHSLLKAIAVFAMFLVVLWVQIMSTTDLLFGSIHDTSLHALFVELILEKRQIPMTHQPYLAAAIIYPQGSHVIFAYSSHVLGFMPAKAVFDVSLLFNAMSVLAAYFLGKKVNPTGRLGVSLAFVMSLVSIWPLHMTWGSNPFITGAPLFFICLGLIPSLMNPEAENRIGNIIVIGILFGYLATIHPSFYEVLIIMATSWMVVKTLSKSDHKITLFLDLLVVFLLSIIVIAPFLYRYAVFYPYPGHNIGLPNDLVGDPTTPPTPTPSPRQPPISLIVTDFSNWLFSNYNIHPKPVLRYLWIGLFFGSIIAIIVELWTRRKLHVINKVALAAFGACSILILATYVEPIYISWVRFPFILYFSACILIAAFNTRLCSICNSITASIFGRILRRPDKSKVAGLALTLLTFSAVYTPFVYYFFRHTPQRLTDLYRIFSVTKMSDYELMYWMRDNLQQNVTILINPYESGTFIPSVSQKRVAYPLSAYQLSLSYRTLVDLIQRRVLNETTYILMHYFDVTYVFLGSQAAHQLWWEENPKWDPLLFLGNPNFRLVNNVENSYLFKVSYKNPNVVFEEDFEYLNLAQMAWRFAEMENGNHNITIIDKGSNNRLLRIEAEKDGSSRWLYACWLNRTIYLPSNRNVRLAFYLNASDVYAPNTIAVSIFDIGGQRRLTFATPSVFYSNQSGVVGLQNNFGNFSFNVSEIWELNFGEPLPNRVVLELAAVNVDNDSSTVTYFDDITITTDQ